MIEILKLSTELAFRVYGEKLEQIYQWDYAINKAVFEEQLETGSYKGFIISPGIKFLMEKAKECGKIMPYYGVGGSSGACIYTFQIQDSQCSLKVENCVTKDVLNLLLTIEEANSDSSFVRHPEIQFSIAPYIFDEELTHPWSGGRNQQLVCKIAGKEYQNLVTWKNWREEQSLTSQYAYSFGQVSLGPTGLTVKVFDNQTEETIDITDYDDW